MSRLLWAAALAAFFVAGCQMAPEPIQTTRVASTPTGPQLQCGHRDKVLALLERFGERLQSAGVTSGGYLAEVYANPETGTWTWVLTRPDGISCIWGAREGWRQIPDSAGGPEA